jgi:hypothetical protein
MWELGGDRSFLRALRGGLPAEDSQEPGKEILV